MSLFLFGIYLIQVGINNILVASSSDILFYPLLRGIKNAINVNQKIKCILNKAKLEVVDLAFIKRENGHKLV